MVSTRLYVEGGGDSKTLKTACRKGFRSLLEKAGLTGRLPRIVAAGSRRNAYESFKTAHGRGDENVMLLVDAEGPVTADGPWRHLKTRDGWDRPDGATDEQCHLMVEVMESWFLADREALEAFYGQGYRSNALPPNQDVEQIPKRDVLDGLAQSARSSTKGGYDKGAHSFRILEKLDPEKVRDAAPHADRFLSVLLSRSS